MLDLQEISDRIEIQDLMTTYASVIDRRNWERYPTLFTSGARVDYTAAGGIAGAVPEILAFLQEALSASSASQHMMSNFEIELDGDTAAVRCMLHNPMMWGEGEEMQKTLFGLWYALELERREGRWLIASMAQELSYTTGPLP